MLVGHEDEYDENDYIESGFICNKYRLSRSQLKRSVDDKSIMTKRASDKSKRLIYKLNDVHKLYKYRLKPDWIDNHEKIQRSKIEKEKEKEIEIQNDGEDDDIYDFNYPDYQICHDYYYKNNNGTNKIDIIYLITDNKNSKRCLKDILLLKEKANNDNILTILDKTPNINHFHLPNLFKLAQLIMRAKIKSVYTIFNPIHDHPDFKFIFNGLPALTNTTIYTYENSQ